MVAETSYPTSEVGVVAEMSYPISEVRGSSQEELPYIRGQGQRPRVPGCDGAGMARGATPCLRSGVAAGRSYPSTEARGSGREEQPHVQGALASRAQEGLEELFHVQGQEGRR